MYGGKDENLNELRYHRYMSAVASSNLGIRPEKLPATKCAAKYHAQRVHLQVLQWAHPATVITLENWGLKVEGGKYLPIMIDKEPTNPELLNVIRCKCKKDAVLHALANAFLLVLLAKDCAKILSLFHLNQKKAKTMLL